MKARSVAVGLALAVVASGVGCKREKHLAGVDRWNVKRTRLADATGRCMPEKLPDGRDGAYCVGQAPMGVRGMTVDLDLYFASMDPAAMLVEIQMKVGGCLPEELESWMRTNFGAPTTIKGTRQLWQNAHLYAIGYFPMPDEPGRCLVRIVPTSEEARFQRIWGPAS